VKGTKSYKLENFEEIIEFKEKGNEKQI